jgi:hypothetical protein
MAVWNWGRSKRSITPLQVANIVSSAMKSERRGAESEVITPIVEFLDLEPDWSASGSTMELFAPEAVKNHPYLRGLKDSLNSNHGVYVFYDSRGRALYAGKALHTTLWAELKSAFNRKRAIQRIRRVRHPRNRVEFRDYNEKKRQIYLTQIELYELAKYLSVYVVPGNLINTLEALLVRGFANDLSNVRMENFVRSKAASKKKSKGKAHK